MKHFCMRTLFWVLSLFLFQTLWAQPAIRGRVVDSSHQAVDGALVWLIQSADTVVLAQCITQTDGTYSLPSLPHRAKLWVQCLGYKAHLSEAFDASRATQWPDIVLKEEAVAVEGVTVVARRLHKYVKQEGGKLIYQVGEGIASEGVQAYDLLKNLPGVSMDGAGKEIRVHGKGKNQVLINGKPTYLQPEELIALLKSTPSSQIASMEFISNPSARYEAEGSGVVLNIVMKSGGWQGTHLSLGQGVSYWFHPQWQTEFALNRQQGRWRLYANYNHTVGHAALFYGGIRRQAGRVYQTTSDDVDKRNTAYASAGVAYTPSVQHEVGGRITGSFSFGPGHIHTWNRVFDEGSYPTTPLFKVFSLSDYSNQKANRYHANLYYVYTPTKGRKYTLDLDAGQFVGTVNIDQPNTFYHPTGRIDSLLHEQTEGRRDIGFWALSSSYQRAYAWGQLLMGAKLSGVSSRNRYALYEWEQEKPRLHGARSNDFRYVELIQSAFVEWEYRPASRWALQAGLRGEATQSKGHIAPLSGQKALERITRRHYFHWFPSAGVHYHPTDQQHLSLSYARRIDRPVYADLNPIDQPLDGFSSWRGNPFLRPQLAHKVELGYQYGQTVATTSYTQTNDYFVGVTDTLQTAKMVMQPLNLGTQRHYTLSLSQSLTLWQACRLHLSGTLFYTQNRMAFDEQRRYERHRWAYNAFVQAHFPIGWGIESELTANYHAKRLGGSTEWAHATGSVDIAFRRNFCKDRLGVSLSLSDLFWTSNWDSSNRPGYFETVSYGHAESRKVRLHLSWRFGGGKENATRQSTIESELNRL